MSIQLARAEAYRTLAESNLPVCPRLIILAELIAERSFEIGQKSKVQPFPAVASLPWPESGSLMDALKEGVPT